MKVRGQVIIPPRERIEALSIPEPNSGCWIWLGQIRANPAGLAYGRLTIGNRFDGSRRTVSAHRYSYETYKGPIPDGLYACHHCDVSLCVNPDHLFAGTQRENMCDAYRKGRVDPPHNNRKLSREMVLEAAQLRLAGVGWLRLGSRYGVHKKTISEAIGRLPSPPSEETPR